MRTRAMTFGLTGLFRHPKRKLRKMYHNGDYKEAIEFGGSLEKQMGGDPDFLFIMACIYYTLGSANNCIHYLDRTLAINDSDTEALLMKAEVHRVLGEDDNSRRCCKRLLEVDPENERAAALLDETD